MIFISRMLTSTVTFENLYYSGNIVDCGGNYVITTPICNNTNIYVNIFHAINIERDCLFHASC